MNLGKLLYIYGSHYKHILKDFFPDPLLQKNTALKDRHTNDRCFILGSGGSILTHDLSVLKDEIVMTQNSFHMLEGVDKLDVNYHCVVHKYQTDDYNDHWVRWFKEMEERLSSKTEFIVGKNTQGIIEQIPGIVDRTYYYNHGHAPLIMSKCNTDLTKHIMAINSALIVCLSAAVYMGFKEVVLVGFDFDQICQKDEKDYGRFYGRSIITDTKSEDNMNRNSEATGSVWFGNWIILKQCALLQAEAEAKGMKIINATAGGLIDVFERKKFESYFG